MSDIYDQKLFVLDKNIDYMTVSILFALRIISWKYIITGNNVFL